MSTAELFLMLAAHTIIYFAIAFLMWAPPMLNSGDE
jgi:hypothetical protein